MRKKSKINLNSAMKQYLKKNPSIQKALNLLNITMPEYEAAVEGIHAKKVEVSTTGSS